MYSWPFFSTSRPTEMKTNSRSCRPLPAPLALGPNAHPLNARSVRGPSSASLLRKTTRRQKKITVAQQAVVDSGTHLSQIIRSATLIGAEVLGMRGRLGVIAPGAFADLLAVDGNPLEDLRLLQDRGAHISLIIKEGAIVRFALPQ